jgi:transcriptional regulator
MYVPPAFRAGDDAAADLVAAHPLAQLVVHTDDGLVATPVPLLLRDGALVGHVARPNQVWRHEGAALAIFSGVDAYVSPSWYPSKAEHGRVVPTWNYDTAQAHGTLVAHDDAAWTLAVVRLLTDVFESPLPSPWSVDDAPTEHIDGLLRAIVGIEIVDLRWAVKRKLSQNRDDADRRAVEARLGAGNAHQQAVAEAMRETRD